MLNLEPLHPHELLSWMAIPEYPGVYILGSYARHVTIYSQQMRAFNLIDALCRTGQLRPGAAVAVVGGGIAGLTAAAAATVRGAAVTIIESDQDFFPIQRHAGERYLHPHIYDWPLYESKTGSENRADFPFLDWEAGAAKIVFGDLRGKWDQLFDKNKEKLRRPKALMKTLVTSISNQIAGRVELTVESAEGTKTLQPEIVVLAVGFGREVSWSDLQTYWEQDPFDAVHAKKLRWLVSGYGDGGLTDLMRLCINEFRHDVYVKKYENDPNVADKLRKLLAVNGKQTVRSVFEELYKQLDEDSLILKDQLRSGTEVTFNAPADYLEGEGSSILNRFLVFQLEKLEKFKRQDGWLKLPIPPPDAERKYKIEFTDKDKKVIDHGEFDRLVVRHGPERPISEKSFPEIWQATEDLRKRWAAQSQSDDRTRVQIWSAADYEPSNAPNPILPDEEPHTDVDLRCVIVESTNSRKEGSLSSLVSTALNSNKKAIGLALTPPRDEKKIKFGLKTIKINQALSSQKDYNRAVSLLCKADVAVIDVTRYEPGVMLLLGIRSAVKRGVTVVTTNLKTDAAEWSKLPFNLKELYPLSLLSEIKTLTSPEHPIQVVGRTIHKALKNYYAVPFYQDVPAYEAVRRVDAPPEEESQLTLWLCPFRETYEPHATYIQSGYLEEYTERNERNEFKYPLQRVTEIVSPQLVTQRLYSAIRRTTLCLIDWTFWSSNVFFEFGVRLAVSNFGPVCLLATDTANEADGKDNQITNELLAQREMLKKLFRPLEYSLDPEKLELREQLFKEIRGRHTAMQAYEAPGTSRSSFPPTFGAFPFDHTYKFVAGLSLENELGAWKAHSFLTAAADSLTGVSSTAGRNLPVLFSNVNKALDQQARTAAKEALIAAWYYLGNRYQTEWQQPGELHTEYVNLSIRLAELLRKSNDVKDQVLNETIRQALKTLPNLKEGRPISDLRSVLEPLKRRSRYHRNEAFEAIKNNNLKLAAEEFEAANASLKEGINYLKRLGAPDAESEARASEDEITIAKQLADFCGALGGLYRAQGREYLTKARDAYDEGYKYEGSRRFNILNSYNRVNRLVVRILQTRTLLSNPPPVLIDIKPPGEKTIVQLLSEADTEIERQLVAGRTDRAWALADLVLVRLLAGLPKVDIALRDLDDSTGNDTFPYESTLKVIRELIEQKLPMQDNLISVGERFREKLPPVLQGKPLASEPMTA